MSLEGKNVVITGATNGLGVGIAKTFSEQGANVFIGGRNAERGTKVAEETKSTFHVLDVTDEESNKAFFEAAGKHFGGGDDNNNNNVIDYVMLNAGIEGNNEKNMIQSLDIENYDNTINTNVRGVILGLKYSFPFLRTGCTFVVTSSAASIFPLGINPVYAASKAAVDSLVRSFAAQFQSSDDERIQSFSIYGVNPVAFHTDMFIRFNKIGSNGGDDEKRQEEMLAAAKMFNPSQRLGTVEEFGGTLVKLSLGELPYKSGENFFADADTHFPPSEYFDRMKQAVAQQQSA